MNEVIKKDILEIIAGILGIFEKGEHGDVLELSRLSDRTIHDASIFQDEDSIGMAVVAYSLSKIYMRKKSIDVVVVAGLRKAHDLLLDDDYDDYRKKIKEILKRIADEDKKIGLYIQEVVSQAEVKKGSRIYEHGISLARAAEILGISQWELSSYVGNTTISDEDLERIPVKKRIEFTRKLFQ
jgi:hypothetical protein